MSAFFRGRVAALVELVCDVSDVCRRHADAAMEAARDAVTPASTAEFSTFTVDTRLTSRLRAVDVPSRQVGGTGVVLRLALETLATGQQTEHAA